MTLPFRRRHHDDEAGHDRARALISNEMLEPLEADEAAWLNGHLAGCAECLQDREAYLADRMLLRGLRDDAPIPPRDLWARTSAALDRESRHRPRRAAARPAGVAAGGRRGSALPFGALAGALIVAVVVGVSVLPRVNPPVSPTGPINTLSAVNSFGAQPTTFPILASRIAWIQAAENGNWELVIANVDGVCPRDEPRCDRLGEEDQGRPISLGSEPTNITISPSEKQLFVESNGQGSTPDRIFVLAVPPATPEATPEPPVTEPPATSSGEPVSPEPGSPDPGSPDPTPSVPAGAIEIASGVTVVGEAAYSSDGSWLAFSAQPSDGSTGPDLYLWTTGQTLATAVTNDHATYFSTWLGDRVLASRVEAAAVPTESALPTTAPTAEATTDPSATTGVPVEFHPVSFLLDPETLISTNIDQPDVWLPVVDPTGRFAAYWSGTVVPVAGGTGWQLGTGELVLSGWSDGAITTGSPEPVSDATADPAATAAPSAPPALGPTGARFVVATGPLAEFTAKFDPSGTRLAVWVGEQVAAEVGRLHLVVLDRAAGTIDPGPQPLPGAPALRRFSIDSGRLAWVSPSGQNGEESAVQVLGWSEHEFGEIRTNAARDVHLIP